MRKKISGTSKFIQTIETDYLFPLRISSYTKSTSFTLRVGGKTFNRVSMCVWKRTQKIEKIGR